MEKRKGTKPDYFSSVHVVAFWGNTTTMSRPFCSFRYSLDGCCLRSLNKSVRVLVALICFFRLFNLQPLPSLGFQTTDLFCFTVFGETKSKGGAKISNK